MFRLRFVSLLVLSLLFLTGCSLLLPKPPAPAPCFSVQPAFIPSRVENPEGLPYVPGQLLVRYQEPSGFEPQARLSIAAAVQASFQLTLLQDGGGYGPDLVQVPPGQDVRALAAMLSTDPRVKYAEPNYFLFPLATPPNDPLLTQQWNMLNFGLPQAWAIEAGRESITIAIIDTGVDTRHEDLRGRLWPGCDFGNRDNDPNPDAGADEATRAHGTHVAGIAAATGNNHVGVAGVAYSGVRILPVKVFGRYADGTPTDVVANAIRWSAGLPVAGVNPNPHPARIINISLGTEPPHQVHTLNEAVAEARRAWAIVVAAAGNDRSTTGISSPANASGAVAVGSVNNDRNRSSFSNYNVTIGGRTVDVMAPGGEGPVSPTVCMISGVLSTLPGNRYGCMQGTSMATPFVAGVAALIWSQNPGWNADQVIARLKETAYISATMNPAEYGSGIVCADAALGASTTCGRP